MVYTKNLTLKLFGLESHPFTFQDMFINYFLDLAKFGM